MQRAGSKVVVYDCRRNELVALDLVVTAVSTMFAFVAMIGNTQCAVLSHLSWRMCSCGSQHAFTKPGKLMQEAFLV